MSKLGAKEKSRPSTGVVGNSPPPTVSHKSKTKKENVDLKSKEEEYRFFAAGCCAVLIMKFS